jgi:antitoxin (DNA-binding transcriptional repressor) of toxin-antitoxin stability system
MSLAVSVTEVLRNFAEYVNRVVYRGETFLLVRGGKPVAMLSPVPAGRRLGDLPSLLASLPRLSSEEAASFARDLEEARTELDRAPERDPWES